ncbi:hypothetical protein Pcinc_044252, partial [Petrolisthes cinctipes]
TASAHISMRNLAASSELSLSQARNVPPIRMLNGAGGARRPPEGTNNKTGGYGASLTAPRSNCYPSVTYQYV